MHVSFRADATQQSGAGHVMRSWALAEELTLRGALVSWVGQIDVPWVRDRLASEGWEVHPPTSISREDVHNLTADVVVVDSYSLEWRFREGLLDAGTPVVAIIDDSHTEPGPATLWVNPGIPIERGGLPSDRFLNGLEYVLIRSEIRALRHVREEQSYEPGPPQALTVLLGGTDFSGLWDLAEALGEGLTDAFSVVIGPSKQQSTGKATFMRASSQLLSRAALSDLVISPAGVASWEMLHVGAPLALLLATENQRGNYEWMCSQNLAFGLGDSRAAMTAETLRGRTMEALAGAQDRAARGCDLVDGGGCARVADAILRLL